MRAVGCFSVAALCAVLASSVAAFPVQAAGRACPVVLAGSTLPGQFTGTVRTGPDAGLLLTGTIVLHVGAAGALNGVLQEPSGAPVAVSGDIAGQSLHLSFAAAPATTIHGVGVLPAGCLGTGVSGTLRGPQPPDHGDWGIIWGD